jgi:hypothetical protein
MTEAVLHPKCVIAFPPAVVNLPMKNEDQTHTVANIRYGLFGEPSSKLTGEPIRHA